VRRIILLAAVVLVMALVSATGAMGQPHQPPPKEQPGACKAMYAAGSLASQHWTQNQTSSDAVIGACAEHQAHAAEKQAR
jgi:hypothetical protein